MSRVTPEQTDALARLARLSLDAAERDRLAEQLGRIVAYLDTLREVELDGVAEYEGAQAAVGLREDREGEVLGPEQALAGVPAHRDGHVDVPRFKED